MRKIINDKPYQEMKDTLKTHPAGRYFAVNSKTLPFDDNGPSHAFSILLNKKSIGIAGNNAELTNVPYNGIIKDTDLISVWGPISDNTILTATDNHIIKTN